MTIAYYIVAGLHVFACSFLIAVVLLQQGKGQDLASAFGGGGTQTAFGPRGSANVLSRATTILAGVFMVTSLALSLMKPKETSVIDTLPAAQTSPSPEASVPAAAPAASPTPAGGPATTPEASASPETK